MNNNPSLISSKGRGCLQNVHGSSPWVMWLNCFSFEIEAYACVVVFVFVLYVGTQCEAVAAGSLVECGCAVFKVITHVIGVVPVVCDCTVGAVLPCPCSYIGLAVFVVDFECSP